MSSDITRRSFAFAALGTTTALAQNKKDRTRRTASVILGVCSPSLGLKDASPEELIAAVKAEKLSVVSLGAPHFSPWARASSGLAEMRALRTAVGDAGILIRSVSVEIAPSRTDDEISRMLAMANALDVRHVAAEAPVAMLGRVNELARRHGVIVALRNTAELKSVTEMQNAIHSFGSLGLAVDCSKLEAGGSDPVDLLRHTASRIFELRFRAGTPKTAEVLRSVRYEHPLIPLLIDTESPADIAKSVEFYRESIKQRPAGTPPPRTKQPASANKKG